MAAEVGDKRSTEKEEELTSFLVRELSSLSAVEREAVLDDIHGVAGVAAVDRRQIESSLAEFDRIFYQEQRQSSLLNGLKLEPVVVRSLRLKFLRRFNFDVATAVQCMLRHFQLKVKLFGREKVNSKITQNDLNPKDLECLNNGHLQLLPQRDRAGVAGQSDDQETA